MEGRRGAEAAAMAATKATAVETAEMSSAAVETSTAMEAAAMSTTAAAVANLVIMSSLAAFAAGNAVGLIGVIASARRAVPAVSISVAIAASPSKRSALVRDSISSAWNSP